MSHVLFEEKLQSRSLDLSRKKLQTTLCVVLQTLEKEISMYQSSAHSIMLLLSFSTLIQNSFEMRSHIFMQCNHILPGFLKILLHFIVYYRDSQKYDNMIL
eukprot:Sdes_comp23197_c0_seq1m21497